jgi:hypothetical protein
MPAHCAPVLWAPHLAPSSLADLGAPNRTTAPSKPLLAPTLAPVISSSTCFQQHSCSFSYTTVGRGPSASHTSRTSRFGSFCPAPAHVRTKTKLAARVGHRLFLPSFLILVPSSNPRPGGTVASRVLPRRPSQRASALSSSIRILPSRNPHHIRLHCASSAQLPRTPGTTIEPRLRPAAAAPTH